MNEVELAAWLLFAEVVKNFLGNYRAANYKETVNNMLGNFTILGINEYQRAFSPQSPGSISGKSR